jgi:isopentenyl diphosphate isomerase/L-lactate dehydrogenase-like FMN-dependent dehydrogenase
MTKWYCSVCNIYHYDGEVGNLKITRTIDTKSEKSVVITADDGMRTRFDIIKLLALGTDFVLMTSPLVQEAIPPAGEGVKRLVDFMKADITKVRIMTSCNTLDYGKDILFKNRG